MLTSRSQHPKGKSIAFLKIINEKENFLKSFFSVDWSDFRETYVGVLYCGGCRQWHSGKERLCNHVIPLFLTEKEKKVEMYRDGIRNAKIIISGQFQQITRIWPKQRTD